MIDTWATVGSCAQIGKNCHISGGAGIGGVLEPLQAGPVIIEDNCFVGARSEVAEGVIVRNGAVLSMGVLSRRLDQDRRPRERTGSARRGAGLFRGGARHAAGQERRARALLRGHRQARGRAHALQDQHQRVAEGLKADEPMTADPVAIARDLLRCRSVTPAEGGALKFLEAHPEGRRLHRASHDLQRAGRRRRGKSLRPHRHGGAASDVRRPYRRGAARRREGLDASAVRRRSGGRRALRPRRGRHEGRHRLRARRRARSSRGATAASRRARSRS